ncbi:MAG: aldo/keto reductase [Brevirhabdus sp.]
MSDRITTPDGTPASALCFGTMQFGGRADSDASRAMYDACRSAGVNFFDTAHVYTDGRSETLLGQFIADERDKLIIATKAGYKGGATRTNIEKTFDESRGRLGIDVVDILYMHRWDGDTPLEETFETLAGLKDKGLVRHVGVSNYAAWQVMKAHHVARTFGIGISIVQPMLNLVKRQAEVEILPMAASEGFAVAPYSPLGGGLLTGKYATMVNAKGRLAEDERYAARYGQRWMHDTAREFAQLSRELGANPATLAVAWVAGRNGVTAPIISARSAAQLEPSLDAMGLSLDEDLSARISALSRAPAPATDRLEEG